MRNLVAKWRKFIPDFFSDNDKDLVALALEHASWEMLSNFKDDPSVDISAAWSKTVTNILSNFQTSKN